MKRPLSILMTAVLGISLTSFPVYAQKGTQRSGNKTGQHQRPGNRSVKHQRVSMEQRFAKELSLTTTQQSKINPILKKHNEQTRAIYSNSKLSREQKRAQSTKLFEALPSKINKYLNKTQQAKLKQMVANRKNFKGRRNGKRGDRRGTPPQRKK